MSDYNSIIDGAIEPVTQLSDEDTIEIEKKLLMGKHLFDIEASGLCNLQCNFCPQQLKRHRGLMSVPTMIKLSQWIPQGSDAIISGLGEPLMNPSLPLLVSSLKKNKINVAIITNGQLLTGKKQQELIHAGVDELQVSLHTFDEGKYEKITSKPWLSTVLENLNILVKMRNRPKVRINCVFSDDNWEELVKLREFSQEHGCELFIRRVHSRGGSIPIDRTMSSLERSGCGTFSKATFIAWNGDILPCSNDVHGSSCYGNISDVSFEKIVATKLREITHNHRPDICKKCDDDYRFLILSKGGVNFEL